MTAGKEDRVQLKIDEGCKGKKYARQWESQDSGSLSHGVVNDLVGYLCLTYLL